MKLTNKHAKIKHEEKVLHIHPYQKRHWIDFLCWKGIGPKGLFKVQQEQSLAQDSQKTWLHSANTFVLANRTRSF